MSIEETIQGISSSLNLGKRVYGNDGWSRFPVCPDCGEHDPTDPAFCINSKTGGFRCHRCGFNGHVYRLQAETNLQRTERINELEEVVYKDSEFYNFEIISEDSLSTKYLKSRAINFETLQWLDVPLREKVGSFTQLAIYPMFHSSYQVIAYQSVLPIEGTLKRKRKHYCGKKSLGIAVLKKAEKVIVAEGLETGLSVLQSLGNNYGLIVCGDSGNLESLADKNSWALKGIKEILIAADNDKSNTGIKSARKLVYKFPFKTSVYMPSLPGNDWNDVLVQGRFEEEWL